MSETEVPEPSTARPEPGTTQPQRGPGELPAQGAPVPPALLADLVLEGGGVRGLGLVGAVGALDAAGYRFPRVGGSSAGAVVGALVAALQRAGEPLARLEELARALDYGRFRDRGPIGRLAGPFATAVDALSLAFDSGVFEGDYLRDYLAGTLADLGVRTFGDLRVEDPESSLPPKQRHGLVVTASDLSRRRLVRFPWDYADYGLDPDEQSVADAVRASASIPFFFEPVTLRPRGGGVPSTLVDGSVLSDFPVAMFDRTDGRPPRWPTFGVRLSARPGPRPAEHVAGPLALGLALVGTLVEACDAQHVDDPCVVARTVFVDASGVSPVDFDLSPEEREGLVTGGREAATRFLQTWDAAGYLRQCRDFESEP